MPSSQHQSRFASAPAWTLAAGEAMTLRPRTGGTLQVLGGCAWVTSEGSHGLSPDDSGDHVLGAGQRLSVRGGERLVIEPWFVPHAAEVQVAWVPQVAAGLAQAAQAWRDLRAAIRQAGNATCRLLAGLTGWAWSR